MTTRNVDQLVGRMQRYMSRARRLEGRVDPYFIRELGIRLDMFRTVLLDAERDTLQQAWEREMSQGRDAEGHLVLTLGPGSESPSRKEGWEKYDGMGPLEQRHADGDR